MECFDEFSDKYELMITWPQRIKREQAFFEPIFEKFHVSSILDAGCGTGMHAIEFSKWGKIVVGCDISSKMIERARVNAKNENVLVQFEVAAFHEMRTALQGTFDAVVCIGNNLPLVLDETELRLSLQNMYQLLSTGGICIIQLQNYERILTKNHRFLPLKSAIRGDNEFLFFRMLDLHSDPLVFHIISFEKDPHESWTYTIQSTNLSPWRKPELESYLKEIGFQNLDFYGSYALEAYEAIKSPDLVIIGQK